MRVFRVIKEGAKMRFENNNSKLKNTGWDPIIMISNYQGPVPSQIVVAAHAA